MKTESELYEEVSELSRQVSNLLRPGTIAEVDYERAEVRVQTGDLLTAWLPFFARRAGNTIDWDPSEPGEQCLILAPSGEIAAGFVLAGIYSGSRPAPSKEPRMHLRRYEDGFEMSYDRQGHSLIIRRKDGLKVKVVASEMSFETEKAEIKNGQGELITTISEALDIIAKSKTVTMMGSRESIDNAAQLPALKSKLDSFLGE